MKLEVIILAAGQGTRMRSALPKVLHELGGRPLLAHVLASARQLAPAAIHVVYGHGGGEVRARFTHEAVNWVAQAQQQGTAHAVMQALPAVGDDALVLVLYGDVPLVEPGTLRALIEAADGRRLALLAVELADPSGYGRIVRASDGAVARIVEERDASAAERALREVHSGLLAAPAASLRRWLARVEADNAKGEYYLTDIVALARAEGSEVVARQAGAADEVRGVNSKTDLAALERAYQLRQASALTERGVTLRDPARFDLRGELEVGRDVVIDVNVVLEGRVVLADGVAIGPNNLIRDAAIGANTQILANCVIEAARIGRDCRIGPFARLRPGPQLADRVHVGNFVEIKKSEIGTGSKINHLSYVGDSIVGREVNIGAGTITCNYDGANKHQTIIGDGAFIGSDTQLVAPVTIGAGATIGAGSTITKDAPAGMLTLSRAQQVTRSAWKRPVKKDRKS